MSFLDLKAKVLQNLPAPLQSIHGGTSAAQNAPGGSPVSSWSPLNPNGIGQNQSAPTALAASTPDTDTSQSPQSKAIPVSLAERLSQKLSARLQTSKVGLNRILKHKNRPAEPANGRPTRPTEPPRPGSTLKPLTVDELLARMPKKPQPQKPKFSISPEEIRFNPSRAEQDSLERQVFALPWNDEDVINPFHTGPCNVTD